MRFGKLFGRGDPMPKISGQEMAVEYLNAENLLEQDLEDRAKLADGTDGADWSPKARERASEIKHLDEHIELQRRIMQGLREQGLTDEDIRSERGDIPGLKPG